MRKKRSKPRAGGDLFVKLSSADRAKLAAVQVEWKRDGATALSRFREADPATYLRIMDAINPRAVREALEEALVDAGLTNTDIRAMAAKARHKH
jgi:hypothetical protein